MLSKSVVRLRLTLECQRLGLAMRTWVTVWREAEHGAIPFKPSRRSEGRHQGGHEGPPAAGNLLTGAHMHSAAGVKKVVTVAFAADSRYLAKMLAVTCALPCFFGASLRAIVCLSS